MVAWSELYLALNQGVVDAAENAPFAIYAAKLHEPATYLIDTQHLYDYVSIYMNDAKFQSLPKEYQSVLTETFNEAGVFFSDSVQADTDACIEKMIEEGATHITQEELNLDVLRQLSYEGAMKLEEEGYWPAGLYQQIKDLK